MVDSLGHSVPCARHAHTTHYSPYSPSLRSLRSLCSLLVAQSSPYLPTLGPLGPGLGGVRLGMVGLGIKPVAPAGQTHQAAIRSLTRLRSLRSLITITPLPFTSFTPQHSPSLHYRSLRSLCSARLTVGPGVGRGSAWRRAQVGYGVVVGLVPNPTSTPPPRPLRPTVAYSLRAPCPGAYPTTVHSIRPTHHSPYGFPFGLTVCPGSFHSLLTPYSLIHLHCSQPGSLCSFHSPNDPRLYTMKPSWATLWWGGT